MKGAPRVLVSGVVLDQPMGGVRRHNAELLPRVSKLLSHAGGELVLMEGRGPIAFELPADIRIWKGDVPSSPAPVRASFEGRALRSALQEEAAAGRPIDLVHLGHMPAPRSLPVPHTHTIHDLRMLTEKTAGNLDDVEREHLEGIVRDLESAYAKASEANTDEPVS